jgi:hypothetical protein
MSNTIEDLREHLFDTLRGLKNKENPMEIERAKAISDVAQTIINSAKAEVDYIKATGAKMTSGFISSEKPEPIRPGTTVTKNANGQRVVTHKMS